MRDVRPITGHPTAQKTNQESTTPDYLFWIFVVWHSRRSWLTDPDGYRLVVGPRLFTDLRITFGGAPTPRKPAGSSGPQSLITSGTPPKCVS